MSLVQLIRSSNRYLVSNLLREKPGYTSIRKYCRADNIDVKNISSSSSSSKTPSDSWVSVLFPFRTDTALQDNFSNVFGGIRLGKMLESLDALAASAAFRHCDSDFDTGLNIVTASVDALHKLSPLLPNADYVMQGCIVYVGKSSMKAHVEVLSRVNDNAPWIDILNGTFTLVALDRTTGQPSRDIPELLPTTLQECDWYNRFAKARRQKQQHKDAIDENPWSPRDLSRLMSMWKEHQQPTDGGAMIPMGKTRNQSTMLMFPESRNIAGKVFGGVLIREAFELAYITAALTSGTQPQMISSSDISFIAPVEIGSVVTFNALVVFATTESLQVRVEAVVRNPATGERKTSNTFFYGFRCKLKGERSIIPETYEHCMYYLEGAKNHEQREIERAAGGLASRYDHPITKTDPVRITHVQKIEPLNPFPVDVLQRKQ